MAGKINLNELPDELPGASPLFPKGKYKVTIEKASMTAPKDLSKDAYLTVVYQVIDPETNMPVAKFWDKFFSSDNQYVRFKLKKFIKALKLPLEPGAEFSLQDIEKMVNMKVGKSIFADFSVNDRNEKDEMQIDIFAGQAYYPLEEPEKASKTAKPSETPVLEEEEDQTDDSDY